MIVRGLRDAGQILDDPELTEYLQSARLTPLQPRAGQWRPAFHFFVVKDSSINAFALPGGFIGVNAGLLLATANESELAGVLAHEIAHVTQRHIARSIQAQSRIEPGLHRGDAGRHPHRRHHRRGGDVMQGAVAVGPGRQRRSSSSTSRAPTNTRPTASASARSPRPGSIRAACRRSSRPWGGAPDLQGSQIPELLQSHPVTSNRIAESRSRARAARRQAGADTLSYGLSRERLRLLSLPPGTDARAYYASVSSKESRLRRRPPLRPRAQPHDVGRTPRGDSRSCRA